MDLPQGEGEQIRGRMEELARLTSGDHITDLSLANAREMLSL